jgi:hypothetical protein
MIDWTQVVVSCMMFFGIALLFAPVKVTEVLAAINRGPGESLPYNQRERVARSWSMKLNLRILGALSSAIGALFFVQAMHW